MLPSVVTAALLTTIVSAGNAVSLLAEVGLLIISAHRIFLLVHLQRFTKLTRPRTRWKGPSRSETTEQAVSRPGTWPSRPGIEIGKQPVFQRGSISGSHHSDDALLPRLSRLGIRQQKGLELDSQVS